MDTGSTGLIREPIGRIMGNISRMFLADIQNQLCYLDIQRSFYPLLIIEAGNGQLTQNELASKLMCDKVQVVRIINYLSRNGYVERTVSKDDRRKSCLSITGKARQFLPAIKDAIKKTSQAALKDIPEDKADELYTLLTLMVNNLSSNKNQ